jgi:hypothetical protein
LALAQTAFADERTRANAGKIAQVHLKCAAYYTGGLKDTDTAQVFTKAAREFIEVHEPASMAQARATADQSIAALIAEVRTKYGGNFEDPRIPTRFKTECPKYNPDQNARYRVSPAALARKKGPEPTPITTVNPEILPVNPGIPLTILTGSGKSIPVRVEMTKTVAELKAEIARIAGIPPGQQHLVYEGTRLQDGWLLGKYDIQADSTVQLLLRIRG